MKESNYKSYDDLPLMLSVPQVAAVLGISRAGAYELARSTNFPSLTIGSRIVVPKDKFITESKKKSRTNSSFLPRYVVCVGTTKKEVTRMAKRRANGEGNIRKRKDGHWEGRYTAGHDSETGRPIYKNVLGKTQAEVKEKLREAIEACQALDVTRSGTYTVSEWLSTWYEVYSKPYVRERTAQYYKRFIDQYIGSAIGDISLNKLTARDIQTLYNTCKTTAG